jgi:hypothetical protein
VFLFAGRASWKHLSWQCQTSCEVVSHRAVKTVTSWTGQTFFEVPKLAKPCVQAFKTAFYALARFHCHLAP